MKGNIEKKNLRWKNCKHKNAKAIFQDWIQPYTLMAYFLTGKYISRFFSCSVFNDAWCLVRRLRMALVFLGRKSRGKNFLFLYASLKAAFCFWDITVNTWAIDSLTTLIFESLLAIPPMTLATRRRDSSPFRSFNWLNNSVFDLFLST